jgi:hypothetical protein
LPRIGQVGDDCLGLGCVLGKRLAYQHQLEEGGVLPFLFAFALATSASYVDQWPLLFAIKDIA